MRQRTRLSKAGDARLNKAVFPPTVTAVGFNPIPMGFFDESVKAGKPKMRTVGACMRELVIPFYGVLKNRTPFDPKWSSKKTN